MPGLSPEGRAVTEDEIRELAGYGGPLEAEFAGQRFRIRDDCLAALLTYATAGLKAEPDSDDDPTRALGALYLLLEQCLASFQAFSAAAQEAKADLDDIQAVARRVVELSCARGFWPSMRLLGFIASSLDEFDGMSLRGSGRGLTRLTAREACNLALAICLDGRDEESRQEFFDDLNYEGSPDAEALAAMRKWKAEQEAAAEAASGGDGDHLGRAGAVDVPGGGEREPAPPDSQ